MARNDASRFGNTGTGMSTYIKLRTARTETGGCGYGTPETLVKVSKSDASDKGTIAPVRQVGEHVASAGLKAIK